MATHKSAIKRARQSLRRKERNKTVLTKLKTITKKVLSLVEDNKAEEAKRALQSAASSFGSAVAKGIIHKNNAARKISRLTLKVNSLAKAIASSIPVEKKAAKKAVKTKAKKKAAAKKPKTAARKKKS